jgi:putative redox protein
VITLTWSQGLQFTAEDDHKHKIIVDTHKEMGGLDQGFAPMDLLLVSLAGCMGMDIIAILQKKGGRVENLTIESEGMRAEDHPHRYTKITVRIKCEGDYKREDLVRSFELSRDKYCSVVATLGTNPELEFIV